jgi:hypothetical protein
MGADDRHPALPHVDGWERALAAEGMIVTGVTDTPYTRMPPQPMMNSSFGDTYGSGTVGLTWSGNFLSDAYYVVNGTSNVVFDVNSLNRLEMHATVFDFYVPIASATLNFELRNFANGFFVDVFGETVYTKPLFCPACYLSCKGPAGVLASGHHQFLRFSRTFFVGPVPVEVSVSLGGGYNVDYQVQVCLLYNPPQMLARVTAGAFASAAASAGVNLLVARGGVNAAVNIFNGLLEAKANIALVAGPKLQFNAYLLLNFASFTGRIDAYLQYIGCGWIYLDWCEGINVPLLTWNGPGVNYYIFDLTEDLTFWGALAPPSGESTLTIDNGVHNYTSGVLAPPSPPYTYVKHMQEYCPAEPAWEGQYSQAAMTGFISYYTQKGEVRKAYVGSTPGWHKDDQASADIQPNPDLYPTTWYDRGHLTPAMLFSTETRKTTFVTTNIAPQAIWFNRTPWRIMECSVAKNCNAKVAGQEWVVTGVTGSMAVYSGITVPQAYWKVICRKFDDGSTGAWGHYANNVAASTDAQKEALAAEVYEMRDAGITLGLGGFASFTAAYPTAPVACNGAAMPTGEAAYDCPLSPASGFRDCPDMDPDDQTAWEMLFDA